ncbi:MAG: hypothetical protein L6Q38_00395 [Nitrospira sp.]|nr:hypothetical protein [Nitrospira sp.]
MKKHEAQDDGYGEPGTGTPLAWIRGPAFGDVFGHSLRPAHDSNGAREDIRRLRSRRCPAWVRGVGLWLLAAGLSGFSAGAATPPDELVVKRAEEFEFVHKPTVARDGDRLEIAFETRASCDVTVAVEAEDGRIVRHLACGVLGKNAPPPFQKNDLAQRLVWDGKDDQGRYVDDKESCTVRVSLGLKPQYERMFLWHPKKRVSVAAPLIQAAEEGVYVFEGQGTDHIRLFDREGAYLRTVYPFPAERINSLDGLNWHNALQDGQRLPMPQGYYQSTLLTSGTSGRLRKGYPHGLAGAGSAASAMAVRGSRIALAQMAVNCFGTDGGASTDAPFEGPKVCYEADMGIPPKTLLAVPQSAAIDPTGKWLYLTGYVWNAPRSYFMDYRPIPVVRKVNMERPTDGPTDFLVETGSSSARFDHPTSVACDSSGRIYVSDYLSDRIQVFSPEGKFLKALPSKRPAQVCIHRNTQEIYVFSWIVPNTKDVKQNVPATLSCLGSFDKPIKPRIYELPLPAYEKALSEWHTGPSLLYSGEIDSWSQPLTLWVGRWVHPAMPQERCGIFLMREEKGKLEIWKNFASEVKLSKVHKAPAPFFKQVLYVNPATGHLFVAESDAGAAGPEAFATLQRLDPKTGQRDTVALPFDCQDMAFDHNGLAYLRGRNEIGRYDSRSWREVPFDYGEELDGVSFYGKHSARLIGGLPGRGINWHMGGIAVSLREQLAVAWHNMVDSGESRRNEPTVMRERGADFAVSMYPGRVAHYKAPIFSVYDRQGQVAHKDAFAGVAIAHGGLGIDAAGDLYILASSPRVYSGKVYPNKLSGMLIKVRPGQARVLASKDPPIPIETNQRPARSPDLQGYHEGHAWVEGAEWMFGGVGQNASTAGWCSCSNSRFAFDYFARSFLPEMDHHSVAIVDTAGNLILRVGRYGNVEDGRPLIADGAPPQARSIGGDEVSMIYAPYLATDTDRRLFIADVGNARIVSVKLNYHEEARCRLADVKDSATTP